MICHSGGGYFLMKDFFSNTKLPPEHVSTSRSIHSMPALFQSRDVHTIQALPVKYEEMSNHFET